MRCKLTTANTNKSVREIYMYVSIGCYSYVYQRCTADLLILYTYIHIKYYSVAKDKVQKQQVAAAKVVSGLSQLVWSKLDFYLSAFVVSLIYDSSRRKINRKLAINLHFILQGLRLRSIFIFL